MDSVACHLVLSLLSPPSLLWHPLLQEALNAFVGILVQTVAIWRFLCVPYFYLAGLDRPLRPGSVFRRWTYFQVPVIDDFDISSRATVLFITYAIFSECRPRYSSSEQFRWRKRFALDCTVSQPSARDASLAYQPLASISSICTLRLSQKVAWCLKIEM